MKHDFWIKYRRTDSVKITKVGHIVFHMVWQAGWNREVYTSSLLGIEVFFYFPVSILYYLGGINHD